jgi:hypothetical protein
VAARRAGHLARTGVGGSIILGGRDGIRALDAASGAERWHFPRPVV